MYKRMLKYKMKGGMYMENLGMWAKVQDAIDTIRRGICKRVDIDDSIKVYQVKNVIRIDIKEKGDK